MPKSRLVNAQWDAPRVKYLLDHYKSMKISMIARHLGLSSIAIKKKCANLMISKQIKPDADHVFYDKQNKRYRAFAIAHNPLEIIDLGTFLSEKDAEQSIIEWTILHKSREI